MKIQKFLVAVVLIIICAFGTNKVLASFSFTANSITGTSSSTIDLGSGHDLYLQTTGGNVGIGTLSPTRRLQVEFNTSSHNGAHENIESAMVVTNNSSSDPDSEWHSIQTHLELTGNQDIVRGGGDTSEDINSSIRGYANSTSSATIGSLAGIIGRVDHEGTGTVDNVFQFLGGQFNNIGHGTINNLYGLYLPRGTVNNNGTITNTYGVYVGTLHMTGGLYPGGTQTNNPYSFYASDATSYNYFSGSTGIGVTIPTQKLEVNGGVRLNTVTAKPACSSSVRGTFWSVQGGAGVKDTVEVCAKDAGDAYAWRTIY